jgi:hypothetical protein
MESVSFFFIALKLFNCMNLDLSRFQIVVLVQQRGRTLMNTCTGSTVNEYFNNRRCQTATYVACNCIVANQ